MAARKLAALLTAVLQLCLCQQTPELLPEFLAPLENHTVIQGRDIFFTCVVNHLQTYKVAWIKSDSRAILAIHTHLVAHNPRLSVTHNGHNTWKLHVSNVQKNDSGAYMCQVNTDPMRSQKGYMEVVIPPDIMDDESAEGMVTKEGGSVKLKCIATGSPKPTVTWKREDGRNIILREDGQKHSLKTYSRETLELTGVLRQEMGTYLCIASNNVPPTVSKRYSVDVHFPPVIKVTSELVAAPIDSDDVVLQCQVEASPHAMNTWYRNTGEKLLPSDKYAMSEYPLNDYSWQMNLTVNSLKKRDFGEYVCSSANALGKTDGVVSLQELHLSAKTTPSTLARNTDLKPRKKPVPKGRKKNSSSRRTHGGGSDDFDSLGNDDDLGTTQIMAGNTLQEGHRTERPLALPSLSPPWIILNAANSRHHSVSITTVFFSLLFPTMLFNL
ncbi:dpr-interacting protein lambda [Andrena cerasifolii]|uniref:dpr-interacting protein lambda n=1 Tax=Andrena cerasifolii TaxID=2819439 RepID=UPI0040378948